MNITDGEFAAFRRGNAMVAEVTAEASGIILGQNAVVRRLQAEIRKLQADVATERAARLYAEGQLARARRQ